MAAKKRKLKRPPTWHTMSNSWEVTGEERLDLYDPQNRNRASVIRYPNKTFEFEQLEKNRPIPAKWLHHLLARSVWVFENFPDGTPLESAKRVPAILRPYVNYVKANREEF